MLSAPARQPASAISRISSSRYNTLPRCRGSSTVVKKSRTVPEALSMTPSAKEGSYESQSLPGRNPKSATVQAIALGEPAEDDVVFMSYRLELVPGLHNLYDLREHEVGRREEEIDVGVRLESVGQSGESHVGVPLRRDAGDDVDDVLVLVHHVEEAVAPADRIRVAKVADQDGGLVLAALLAGDLDHVLDGGIGDAAVVGDDRDGEGVRLGGRAVEVNHRHVGVVGRLDRRD